MSPGEPGLTGHERFDTLIALIVIIGFTFAIGLFIFRTWHILSQPLISRRARVLSRRQHSTGGSHVGDSHDTIHIWYYVTFEFSDGSREELAVTGSQYGQISEGDLGLLLTRGSWFQGFERQLGSAEQQEGLRRG